MGTIKFLALMWSFVLFGAAFAQAEPALHHDMQITLEPDTHRLDVVDTITFASPLQPDSQIDFVLHAGLSVQMDGQVGRLEKISTPQIIKGAGHAVPQQMYRLSVASDTTQVTLKYSGEIYHPMSSTGGEYARSFNETPGVIDTGGVFLAHASFWYPVFGNGPISFKLDVSMPPGWKAVSQGRRIEEDLSKQRSRIVWAEQAPQEEIYLIAAEFSEYRKSAGAVEAQAFLREPDPALAQRYLDVTAQFIEMYRQLIGPYPYAKFALVENFWETGYGMPSFTLLGPKVIRLPFILYSSYPHEILHNWWGNGVYVDYEKGNWAEGLTSYLADHLFKEQRGEGAAFRRGILQNYTDFVLEGKDFPLSSFTARHSSVSEAIGYGKTQMLFHMLRQSIGDEAFVKGLHRLYRQYKFKKASFTDLEEVFEGASDTDLEELFKQWVQGVGAPKLEISHVAAEQAGTEWNLDVRLSQIQDGPAYQLNVPLAITLEGHNQAYQTSISMDAKDITTSLRLPAEPLRIDVDPEFDIFRRLERAEIPPALSQAFGAEKALLVLPAQAPKSMLDAYRAFVRNWRQTQASAFEVVLDSELDELPADQAVWLLGWSNRFVAQLSSTLAAYDVSINSEMAKINDKSFAAGKDSFIATGRNPNNPKQAIVLIAAHDVSAVPGLARKLPHYRKYSYLAFQGDEPTNYAKGQWSVKDSPMTVMLGNTTPKSAKLAKRHPLAMLPAVFSEERMMADVKALAAPGMEGRGLTSKGILKAAEHISNAFGDAGLVPGFPGNTSYIQEWTQYIESLDKDVTMQNVIGYIPGNNPEMVGESVVIAAHYDHLGFGWPDARKGNEGKLHAGADDNASGVAVMLELARLAAKNWRPERAIVFVAFTGEESGLLGSKHYVKNYTRYPADKVFGMVNLDTVGRLGDAPITAFGTGSAREWVHIFRGVGFVTGVPIKSVANDFGSSDQKSFLDIGVPAVQFFGTVHQDFHSPADRIDKVDSAGLVKVAMALKETIEYLAARPKPMAVTLAARTETTTTKREQASAGRRVSMGTVPDFAYNGPGVLVTDVVTGSPAEKAGLKAGDLITHMADIEIKNLQGFAQQLRTMNPGDTVIIRLKRNKAFHDVVVALTHR